MAFDSYKTLLQDEAGKISGPRTVIAGFGAGITESLLAVTPFESIKTTLFVPLLIIPCSLRLFFSRVYLGNFVTNSLAELMTANHPTHACAGSCMALVSSGANAASVAFFKGLHLRPLGRQLIPRRGSEVISR